MALTSCPHCGDLKIQLMFNSILCTSHGCKNFDHQWEQDVLSSHLGYINLCFCQACIHCEGLTSMVGNFRFKNVIYDVYYSFWTRSGDPNHFILITHGNNVLDSNYCELDRVDKHRSILGKDHPELVLAYDLFHDKLWAKTLAQVKD